MLQIYSLLGALVPGYLLKGIYHTASLSACPNLLTAAVSRACLKPTGTWEFPLCGQLIETRAICTTCAFDWIRCCMFCICLSFCACRSCISKIQLYGPTNFAPVINQVAKLAEKSKGGERYYILVIITDGVISDMVKTKKVSPFKVIHSTFHILTLQTINFATNRQSYKLPLFQCPS